LSGFCSYSVSYSTGPWRELDVLGNTLIRHKSVPHPMGSKGMLVLQCDTGLCPGALGLGSLDRQHGRQAAGVEELVAVE